MVELLLIFATSSLLTAPWWTAVGAVAAVIVPFLATAAFKRGKASGVTRRTNSNIDGIIDSNALANVGNSVGGHSLAASGSNITQNVILYPPDPKGNFATDGTEGRKSSRPTVWEIMDSIENATPYDRHHLTNKYEGFPIHWPAMFDDMSKDDGGENESWYVSFRIVSPSDDNQTSASDRPPTWVSAHLDLSAYPYLKVAKCGDRCWITGRIRSVMGRYHITLQSGATIEFD